MVLQNHNPSFLLFILASGSLHVGLTFLLPSVSKVSFSQNFSVTEVRLYDTIAEKAQIGVNKSIQAVPQKISKSETGIESNVTEKSDTGAANQSGSASETLNNTDTVGTSTAHSSVDEYTRDLVMLIQKKNVYPRMAQKMGHTGKVLIRLRIARDGQILEYKILEKSPYGTLNEAAEKLVSSLPKLRPFPDGIKEDEWVFNIPIDYKI